MKSILKSAVFNLVILIVITCLLIYLTDHYILTINFYENSGDPIAGDPAKDTEVYGTIKDWIYLSSALYLIIKLCVTALILYTALYLRDVAVSFKNIFKVCVFAEYIFFIPAIIKILWFIRFYPNGTLSDWHKFYALSALSLFPNAPADYSYVLQTVNLFEIAYWFLLGYGINKLAGIKFDQAMRAVVISYVPMLLIWMATVTFCSLMIFPGTAIS